MRSFGGERHLEYAGIEAVSVDFKPERRPTALANAEDEPPCFRSFRLLQRICGVGSCSRVGPPDTVATPLDRYISQTNELMFILSSSTRSISQCIA